MQRLAGAAGARATACARGRPMHACTSLDGACGGEAPSSGGALSVRPLATVDHSIVARRCRAFAGRRPASYPARRSPAPVRPASRCLRPATCRNSWQARACAEIRYPCVTAASAAREIGAQRPTFASTSQARAAVSSSAHAAPRPSC
eukprot:6206619-Pleurochrysis_carterae.AAC.5